MRYKFKGYIFLFTWPTMKAGTFTFIAATI